MADRSHIQACALGCYISGISDKFYRELGNPQGKFNIARCPYVHPYQPWGIDDCGYPRRILSIPAVTVYMYTEKRTPHRPFYSTSFIRRLAGSISRRPAARSRSYWPSFSIITML